jgi:Tfp pilus assembly protein PilF
MANPTKQAIKLIKEGREAAARQILVDILKKDPKDDQAWFLLATVAKTDEQRQRCLKEALLLNPRNETAWKAWENLQQS